MPRVKKRKKAIMKQKVKSSIAKLWECISKPELLPVVAQAIKDNRKQEEQKKAQENKEQSEYEEEEEEESYYETESSHLSNNFITGVKAKIPNKKAEEEKLKKQEEIKK